VLNSPDERIARSAVADFVYHARFLDALGVGPEAKIITHVGGAYDDRSAAMERFVTRYQQLPDAVRRRLVLENDERLFGVPDILSIHGQTGIPLVFDILHHRVNNPADLQADDACRGCLSTWHVEQTPKIHYSTQRVAEREVTRHVNGKVLSSVQAPKLGQHNDWIDPVDFLDFLERMGDARFDVMLEAKQKDRALLRLRESIQQVGCEGRIW
jgi:UV DNA damage endonuclease